MLQAALSVLIATAHLSYSPAPAKASRSSPLVSLRAMSVPPGGAYSASALDGSDSSAAPPPGAPLKESARPG